MMRDRIALDRHLEYAMRLTKNAAPGFACIAALALCGCGGGGDGGSGGGSANQTPIAAAKVTGEAVANATTRFDTAGTTDPDGQLVQRTWAYGDGQSGIDDSHIYAAPGSYSARYTVTDNAGATATATVQVAVAKCSAAGTRQAVLSPFPTVCAQTTLGEIVLEVYPTETPQTAANFLKYVGDGFYSATLIDRVVRDFVIQGGGFTTGMVAKPPTYAPIPLENQNRLRNWQYTLAMARSSDPNSATSQFYINLQDNFSLDRDPANPSPNGYAVFGQVISGTATVDAIGRVATGTRSGVADVPTQDVVVRGLLRLP